MSVSVSVGSDGTTTCVGGFVGLMRGTKIESLGGINTEGGLVKVNGATASHEIGGFIGYIDVKTCEINLSGDTEIKANVTAGSGSNASVVGGIFGYSSNGAQSGYYSAGISTKLIYVAKIDCSGLSQDDAVVYNDDWWTKKTATSLQTITGNSDGNGFAVHAQWRYMGIIRGCTMTVGFIYGKGDKPDNCSSTSSAKMEYLTLTTQGIQFCTFHAKKKDACSPYIESKWANDECIIMEAHLWDLKLDSEKTGGGNIYDHIYFTTQSNYVWDLRSQTETFKKGFKNASGTADSLIIFSTSNMA